MTKFESVVVLGNTYPIRMPIPEYIEELKRMN